MILEKLKKFGLSEKEAKVCGALFELGGSVVTDVAKRAGINRSTTYVLLESLGKRGLVSISERRGVRVYSPVSADRLVEIAEVELVKSKELLDLSRELAATLKKLTVAEPARSKIKAYEGVEGVKIVAENKLEAKEKIRSYVSVEGLSVAFPRYFTSQEKRQNMKGIGNVSIVPDTNENRRLLSGGEFSLKNTHLAPDNGYVSGLDIFDNKVTFISPEENTSFVVESAQFAKGLKSLFDLALEKARKWNVKAEDVSSKVKKEPVLVKAQTRFFGK